MKTFLKGALSVLITACFSLCMFYCFVAGAPMQEDALRQYVLSAAGFSIFFPAFACACVFYIRHLHKIIEDKEKQ